MRWWVLAILVGCAAAPKRPLQVGFVFDDPLGATDDVETRVSLEIRQPGDREVFPIEQAAGGCVVARADLDDNVTGAVCERGGRTIYAVRHEGDRLIVYRSTRTDGQPDDGAPLPAATWQVMAQIVIPAGAEVSTP